MRALLSWRSGTALRSEPKVSSVEALRRWAVRASSSVGTGMPELLWRWMTILCVVMGQNEQVRNAEFDD